MKDALEAMGSSAGIDIDTKTLLGHGLEIKVAVGYRF
jgi:hypothetical protein